MISNLQKAYVIHSRPYKETSLIVTFITEKKGKISAVAKGAKRKNSRLSGNLEPFQCLNIDYQTYLKPYHENCGQILYRTVI